MSSLVPVSHESAKDTINRFGSQLHFIPNQGQFSSNDAQFIVQGLEYQIAMQPSQVSMALPVEDETSPATVAMRFVGSNTQPTIEGQDKQVTRYNYYLGSDPEGWKTDIPSYAKVHYQSIYPNIDAVFYGKKGQLEYDFIVQPGGSVDDIHLDFSGVERMQLDAQGSLLMHVAGQVLTQTKPYTYQIIEGETIEVDSHFILDTESADLRFNVADYDPSYPLMIDPTVLFSNYLGGSQRDLVHDVAVDNSGNVYVTGLTRSSDFLTAGATSVQGTPTDRVFVGKFSASGDALLTASIFSGANGDDVGNAISVGADGLLYVTGQTLSIGNGNTCNPLVGGFPTTIDAFKRDFVAGNNPNCPGGKEYILRSDLAGVNVFVLRLDPVDLQLKYGSYFGGTGDDRGMDIVADTNGQMYVSVTTTSTDFIPTGALAPSLLPYKATFAVQNTSEKAGFFVLSTDGTATTNVYTTYLGGTGRDFSTGIALGGVNGEVFVAGTTESSDFNTTANALFTSNRSTAARPSALPNVLNKVSVTGNEDGFLGKFDITKSAAASALFVTYLGGDSTDEILGMDTDADGNVYLVGSTFSTNATFLVTTTNPPTNTLARFEAFYAKLGNDASGNFAVLNKKIIAGGPSTNMAWDVAVDSTGTTAYVIGETQSFLNSKFTTTNALVGHGDSDLPTNSGIDIFLAEFNASTGTLTSSSLFGGSGHDSAFAFPLDGVHSGFGIDTTPDGGLVYLAGSTQSTDFTHTSTATQPNNPITAAQSNGNNAVQNGFLIGIGSTVNLSITKSTPLTTVVQGMPIPYVITVTNNSLDLARNVVVTDDLTRGTGAAVFTYASDTSSFGNNLCSVTNNLVTCALGDIASNTSKAITLNLIALNPGSVQNLASVTARGSATPTLSTLTPALTVTSNADLAVNMTATPTAIAVNGEVTYNINIVNNGPSTAQGIVFTDNLPAATGFVSVTTPVGSCIAANVNTSSPCGCSLTLTNNQLSCGLSAFPLNNGGTHVITVKAQTTSVGLITNTASVSASTNDNNTGNNSTAVDSNVATGADIRLTSQGAVQEALGLKVSRQTTPGSPFSYKFQVENVGSKPIAGALVNMPIPQGVPVANINWTCTVLTANAICLGASSGTGNLVDATITLPIQGKVEFTMSVAPSDPARRGSLVDTATVTMPTGLADLNPNNNALTFVDELTPVTNLVITKQARFNTVLNTVPSNPSNITYDIKVTNSGPSKATSVVVTDTLPGSVGYLSSTPTCTGPSASVLSCNVGVLDVGATTTFVVVVSAPTTAGQTVSNVAQVTSTESTTGASATATTRIVDVATAAADISMNMTAVDANNDQIFSAGEAVTYNVIVANSGPFDATNVSVTFTFPNASLFSNVTGFACAMVNTDEIKCDIGALLAHTNTTASATYTLPNATGIIDVNAKAASADLGDPFPTNNFANLRMNVVTAVVVTASSNAGGGSSGAFFLIGLFLFVMVRRIPSLTRVKKALSLGIFLSLLGLSSVATAKVDNPFYLQASYGQSAFASFNAADISNRVQADGFSVTSVQMDNSRAGKEYLLGYQFKPNWAAELSYIDLDNVRVSPQGNTSNIDAFLNSVLNNVPSKSRGVLLNVLGKRHAISQIDVYGRAGLFLWKSDIEVHATTLVAGTQTIKSVSRSDRGADIFFAAGTAFNITDQWALLLEWKSILGDEIVNFVSGGVRYTLPVFSM